VIASNMHDSARDHCGCYRMFQADLMEWVPASVKHRINIATARQESGVFTP